MNLKVFIDQTMNSDAPMSLTTWLLQQYSMVGHSSNQLNDLLVPLKISYSQFSKTRRCCTTPTFPSISFSIHLQVLLNCLSKFLI